MKKPKSTSLLYSSFLAMSVGISVIAVFMFAVGMLSKNDTIHPEEIAPEKTEGGVPAKYKVGYDYFIGSIPLMTTTRVQKIGELNMGMVAVKLNGRNDSILVLVTPYRKITVGSEVKLVAISYRNHVYLPTNFLVVRN